MLEATGSAHDDAQQAILGEGTQNVFFGGQQAAEQLVPIEPPERPRFPLRGRDELLTALMDGWGRVHVVHGLGGCGKTHIASELVSRVEGQADVWWLSAMTDALLQGGLWSLGRRLGITGDQLRGSDFADRLWDILKTRDRRWLLVIDNADDASLLNISGMFTVERGRGWVRPVRSDMGAVLVTSRDGDEDSWGTWCTRHQVGVVSPDDGAVILRDRAPRAGDHAAARALAERLGGLPLALDLTGAYLARAARHGRLGAREVIRTFDGFRAALDSGRAELVFPDGKGDLAHRPAGKPLAATWNLSLQYLERQGMPTARPLLSVLAQFEDAPVPYEDILSRDALYEDGEFSREGVEEALSGLARLSLVDLISPADSELPLLTLHPLIRELGRSQAPAHYGTLARALLAATVRDAGDPADLASWRLWDALRAHVDAWIRAEATPESALAAYKVVEHLLATGQSTTAEAAVREHLGRLKSSLAADDESVLAARYLLARSLLGQARLDEAMSEFVGVLAIQRRLLGDDSPAILRTRFCLALIMQSRARFAEAEAEMRSILTAQLSVLGTEHVDVMETRQAITHTRAFQGGRFAEAEAELRSVLAICERVYGTCHDQSISARSLLAWSLRQQGRYREAESEYRELLSTKTRVLGPEHPGTLATRNDLGDVITDQGRYAEAEEEYRQVLATKTRVLGLEHPGTLATRNDLGMVFFRQDRFAEAEEEYRRVLAVRMRVLGPEHPSTLATRNDLGLAIDGRGRYVEAEEEYRRVLAVETRVLGPEHPSTLVTQGSLGVAFYRQGRYAEAEEEYRHVLAVETRVLGPEHPSTLILRSNLAFADKVMGKEDEAVARMREVLVARTRVLGPEHPDTERARQVLESWTRKSPP